MRWRRCAPDVRSERGSSLVETLVAVVILGVGVLPVIGLMGAGYRYQGQARLDVQMAALAEAKVEEFMAVAGTSLPDTVALTPGGSVDVPGTNHSDTIELGGRTYLRLWQVQLGPAGVRDITLRVTPQNPSMGRAIEVSTQVRHE